MNLVRLGAALALAGFAAAAAAQYPSKPIRIINPFAPGGTGDVISRSVAQKITESTGKSIIVENRTGAGGRIGYELAIKSAADGYTLALSDTTFTLLPALYRNPPWSASDGLAPVTILAETPFMVIANPSIKVSTLKDLIALAKSQPGRMNFGSAGTGSVNHVSAELFRRAAGVDMTHIPYKGMSDAITGMMTGSVDMLVLGVFVAAPHIKSGKVVPLAVAGAKRSAVLPEVPTTLEAGLPQFIVGNWFGWSAPKGTPNEVIDWLYKEIRTALASPAIKDLLATQGAEASAITPEQFAKVMRDDAQRWSEVIRSAGITAE